MARLVLGPEVKPLPENKTMLRRKDNLKACSGRERLLYPHGDPPASVARVSGLLRPSARSRGFPCSIAAAAICCFPDTPRKCPEIRTSVVQTIIINLVGADVEDYTLEL